MDSPEMLRLGLLWYFVFVLSTTLHEAAHALAAQWLGDSTAYEGGQVTLNPLPHIQREPVGMVLAPLLSFGLGGWMIGWASAPYDIRWANRYPHRAAWMALAGPAANLLLVIVSGLLIRAGMWLGWFDIPADVGFVRIADPLVEGPAIISLATVLSLSFSLNLLLFVFNLLPFPPLDGSTVITLSMTEDRARRWQSMLMEQPYLGFIGLFIAWRGLGFVLPAVQVIALKLLYPEYEWRIWW